MIRKKWKTPELIVFIKGAPEDSILTSCKSAKSPVNALGSTMGQHCQAMPPEGQTNCGACQSNGGGIS